jgi:hypothetical protein
MLLAPIGLFVWNEMNRGHHIRGALTEAAGRIVLGYAICITIFLFAAAISFFIRRRHLVAENLLQAGIAFLIAGFLLPYCATA